MSIWCYGKTTLSNGIEISYPANYGIDLYYTNVNESSDDVVSYGYDITRGMADFTSDTGYSGTMTMNADGTGSGEIKNAGGTAVSTFTWDAAGLCSVDYADAAIADTQYYLTNVMAAMN